MSLSLSKGERAGAAALTNDRDGQQRDQSSTPVPSDPLFAEHLGCETRDARHSPSGGLHPALETVELRSVRTR